MLRPASPPAARTRTSRPCRTGARGRCRGCRARRRRPRGGSRWTCRRSAAAGRPRRGSGRRAGPPAAPRRCPPGRGRPRPCGRSRPGRSGRTRCRTSPPRAPAPAARPGVKPAASRWSRARRDQGELHPHQRPQQVGEAGARDAGGRLHVERARRPSPSSTWSRGGNPNAGGSPTRRSSTRVVLAAVGGGVLGQVRQRRPAGASRRPPPPRAAPPRARASSSPRRRGLRLLGARVAPLPCAPRPTALLIRVRSARAASTRARSARARSSASSSSATVAVGAAAREVGRHPLRLGADQLEVEHGSAGSGSRGGVRALGEGGRTAVEVVPEHEGAAQAGDLEHPPQAAVRADQPELALRRRAPGSAGSPARRGRRSRAG